MPLRMIHTLAHMLFLDARGARLEACEVDGVGFYELFSDGDDVGDEAIQQVEGHAFAHHNAENLGGGASGWKGVVCPVVSLLRGKEGNASGEGRRGERGKMGIRTRDNILLRPQQSAHALLLHVAKIPLEILREAEGHDRQAGIVLGARLPLLAVFNVRRAFVVVLSPLAVDVAHAHIPPGFLERFAQ